MDDLKPMFAYMLFDLGTSAARERAILPEVKHQQLVIAIAGAISNVEVKNIGSAGCAVFAQWVGMRTVMQS